MLVQEEIRSGKQLYENNKKYLPDMSDEELSDLRKQIEAEALDALGLGKDYGHAAVLATKLIGKYRWSVHRGSWMRWNGKVWIKIEGNQMSKITADTLRQEYAHRMNNLLTKSEVSDLAKLITEICFYCRIIGALNFFKGWERVTTLVDEWDLFPWLLNVDNGLLDLKTGQLGKHDSTKLLTKLAKTEYQQSGENENSDWQQHLKRFLPNANIRRQVQRDLGISLVGTTVQEMLPIWYGSGANGKTTTSKVIQKVLRDYVCEAAPDLLIASNFERHPTELADLESSRIVFSSEIGKDKKLDEARVRRLTGGDTIKARFMRQDFFEFEQTFTIFLICNHHPIITGTDTAIWRRVRIVPWTVEIPEKERLPQEEIVKKLAKSGPEIIAWLLAGLRDWQEDNSWQAEEVRAATAAYRSEQDRLIAFLTDNCEEAPHYTVPVGELFDIYSGWCGEAGEEALGKTAFGSRLRDRGMYSKRGAQGIRKWCGIRLKNHDQVTLGDGVSSSPIVKQYNLGEHGDASPKVTYDKFTLDLKDLESLKADALKLEKYLNDEKIPSEKKEKELKNYEAIVEKIAEKEAVRI